MARLLLIIHSSRVVSCLVFRHVSWYGLRVFEVTSLVDRPRVLAPGTWQVKFLFKINDHMKFRMAQLVKRFIDIGANLTDEMYQGIYHGSKKHEADLSHVLKRAWEAGLSKMVITGTSLSDSKAALELAKTNEHLYCTVGCHPTLCEEFEKEETSPDAYLEELLQLTLDNREKVVAIGECGLDYDRTQFCSPEIQRKNSTQTDTIASNSSLKTAENLVVAASIPTQRLMIETDCPWCEVRPTHAGHKHVKTVFQTKKKEKWEPGVMVKGRNEPNCIVQILEVLAAIKKEDHDELAEQLYNNTTKLFFPPDTGHK
ncbi:putative deoxyribonuclease TATDN1 [Chionoecetes opilio]|uniref:Deoxyribonuclease TATDN1 n=1 Tax=Chionoecetes opilio TaxID=41210 RepID=A0A8J5CS84_CHIOP|nr:putative deoxyribonuclease TATDN1 [Chionoecetes opilio]